MADFSLRTLPTFPDGTTVGAYLARGQSSSSSGPLGSPLNEQVVSGGQITFTGLTRGESYIAFGLVSGTWKRISFRLDPPTDVLDLLGDLPLPSADQFTYFTPDAEFAAISATGREVVAATTTRAAKQVLNAEHVIDPRDFGSLNDTGLTDHTPILQAAIDQAAANYAGALNERDPTTVLLPRSQLNITQIVKKRGVSLIGQGWTGLGGATSRVRQLPGVNDQAIIFEGYADAGSNYTEPFRMENFVLQGRVENTVGSGINCRITDTSVDGGRLTIQDGNFFRFLLIAGFAEDGIHLEAGMVPGCMQYIRPHGNEGYGINYDVSGSSHPTSWGVHFLDVSGDFNGLGVIGIKGVGQTADTRDGAFVFTNIKSEKGNNIYRPGATGKQDNVIVFEECSKDMVAVINGLSHGSSYTPDSGITYEAPGAAIRIIGSATTKVPEIIFNGVRVHVRSTDTSPTSAVTIKDDANSLIVPRTIKAGHYSAFGNNTADAGQRVRHVIGDTGEFVPIGSAAGGAAGTGIQAPGWMLRGDSPVLGLYRTSADSNTKHWVWTPGTNTLDLRLYNDDGTFRERIYQISAATFNMLLPLQITSGASIRSGTGTPEGAVTGSKGDLYLRTDGGAGTTLYVKESGSATNTGWVGK